MKKITVIIACFIPMALMAQDSTHLSRDQRKAAKKEKVNQMIKQEEEGALIFQKQWLLGLKLNTDGWNLIYEHGKFKTIEKTKLWWLELGEHQNSKQEKLTLGSNTYPGVAAGNAFVYGKENNFYYLKLGLGDQYLIGGKGNKSGVAVSAIYGGGLSLGLLKPYYLQVVNPLTGELTDIKYTDDPTTFMNTTDIIGASAFGTGFNQIKIKPGIQLRSALRFDYGRYNETLSAIEVGVNFEYYLDAIPVMVDIPAHHAFVNAFIGIEFGKRK